MAAFTAAVDRHSNASSAVDIRFSAQLRPVFSVNSVPFVGSLLMCFSAVITVLILTYTVAILQVVIRIVIKIHMRQVYWVRSTRNVCLATAGV